MRVAALAIVFALASSTASADPFSDLTKGGDACFRRNYDAAHLRQSPRQQFTSMVVWIAAVPRLGIGNVGLAVTRRGDPDALFLSGSCEWGDYKPPIDWMPTFKKRGGAACITSAVPDVFESSSAEEGGTVMFDPARDGRSVVVHLDEQQVMVRRANRAKKIELKLGADDLVFLLRRTGLKDCEAVKEAVTTPEPGVRQR